MASFLRPCINGCGKLVRFMSVWDIPDEVVCDPCVKAIAANEASAKKAAKRKVKREPSRSHSVPGVGDRGGGRGRFGL